MNSDVMKAVMRLEKIKESSYRHIVYNFGSGSFGIMAVFDDGSQSLKAYGFTTAEDAMLFRAFANTIGTPEPERLQAAAQALGVDLSLSSAKWLRFDIVQLGAYVENLEVPRG